MTPNQFRKLALSLPEAVEGAHHGHADFRIRGKIFASLGPDEDWGMVRLPRDRQAERTSAEPQVFEAFGGAWGRAGCTKVWLASARKTSVEPALVEAWRRMAPKRLVEEYDGERER